MKRFSDIFRLTKKEKSGFLIILLFLGLLVIFPFVRSVFQAKEPLPLSYTLVGFSDASIEERGLVGGTDDEPQGLLSGMTHDPIVGELFHFDPNNLPTSSWKRLGLSDKQVQVIKNYESKGGKFYKKEDVKKLYSISDAFYQRIEPYIQIPSKATDPVNSAVQIDVKETEKKEVPVIDINIADTAEWKKLRGIGTVFANRIVRFREGLGGFHKVEQIKEVYGVSEELYSQILPFIRLEEVSLNKIKVNSATKDQLQKHPYISPKQADSITKYRQQHGSYASIEEMRKIIILDDDFFRKIEPYLDFEP